MARSRQAGQLAAASSSKVTVDSSVIGHLPHAHQLGAVAVGGSLYTLLVWVMGFLRMGTTGFAAQAAGRNDGGALRQILLQGLLLALGFLIAFVFGFMASRLDGRQRDETQIISPDELRRMREMAQAAKQGSGH